MFHSLFDSVQKGTKLGVRDLEALNKLIPCLSKLSMFNAYMIRNTYEPAILRLVDALFATPNAVNYGRFFTVDFHDCEVLHSKSDYIVCTGDLDFAFYAAGLPSFMNDRPKVEKGVVQLVETEAIFLGDMFNRVLALLDSDSIVRAKLKREMDTYGYENLVLVRTVNLFNPDVKEEQYPKIAKDQKRAGKGV